MRVAMAATARGSAPRRRKSPLGAMLQFPRIKGIENWCQGPECRRDETLTRSKTPLTRHSRERRTMFRVKARETESASKRRHHPIYATEASGLLVIAFLILAFLIVRYWHAIHWSLR